MANGQSQMIMEELKQLRQDVSYIKEHMVEMDMVLTPKEAKRLEKGLQELRTGRAKTLEQVERERRA